MAIVIPGGCYRQPTESEGVGADGFGTLNYVLKGDYNALQTLLRNIEPGDNIIKGWIMSTADLARNPGDVATLTINCKPDPDDSGEDGGGGSNSVKALKEVWTLRAVRNDMSILAYCGPSEGANPQRTWIEAWQKEVDGDLAREYKFRRPDESIFEIRNKATKDLIGKIMKGIDSVMRFYPQLTRTRTYSKPPAKVYENLAMIDVPKIGTAGDFETDDSAGDDITANKLLKPGNLDVIIKDHVWLKCQDDCQQTADGKYTRTESWIGCLSDDGGWDVNLYGGKDDRWDMPYTTT